MARKLKHKGVLQRGDVWCIRYVDVDGRRVTRSVGTYEDAVDLYTTEKVRIRRGDTNAQEPRRGVRYSQLIDDALKYSTTAHRDTRMFRSRLESTRPQFGHRLVSSLRPVEIKEWLLAQAWGPGTRNRVKAAMSKAFKLGVENQKCTVNPARLVPQFTEPVGRLRFLADDEEARLRAVLQPYQIAQLDVALHTGMRKGEQFPITVSQVDLQLRHIHLDKTKNGSSRYVHLNSTAVKVFTDLKEQHTKLGLGEDASLFLSGRNIPMTDPREWFNRACEQAGIKGVTWHTLRHTFASRLSMAGVPVRTLMELMGHKTIAMSMRYSHLSPEHNMAALEQLTLR